MGLPPESGNRFFIMNFNQFYKGYIVKRFTVFLILMCSLIAPLTVIAQPDVNKIPQKPKLIEVQISDEIRHQVSDTKANRTLAEKKMTSSVLEVARQYQANGNTFVKPIGQMTPQSISPIQSASKPKVDT